MAEPELLAVPDVADALGIDVLKVRQLLRDGVLLAIRDDGNVLRIPAEFVQGGQVVKHLRGVITLLRDNNFADDEAVEWLFTEDDSLPGTPVQALRDDRSREVKRRAQALA